jgi:hypothetical protein
MKISRENLAQHLIIYQLKLINKTPKDAYKDKEWSYKWTIPENTYKEYRKYALNTIQKVLKCSPKKSRGIFGALQFCFGLNIEKSNQ